MGADKPLDPILHQPVRTRLVAFLAARGEATFKELKELLHVTDGNLDAHIRKLLVASYIVSRKEQINKRYQTFYSLTEKGRKQFQRYVLSLQNLLSLEKD
jgi:DNA-binding MarR family transcriptional regulator